MATARQGPAQQQRASLPECVRLAVELRANIVTHYPLGVRVVCSSRACKRHVAMWPCGRGRRQRQPQCRTPPAGNAAQWYAHCAVHCSRQGLVLNVRRLSHEVRDIMEQAELVLTNNPPPPLPWL